MIMQQLMQLEHDIEILEQWLELESQLEGQLYIQSQIISRQHELLAIYRNI